MFYTTIEFIGKDLKQTLDMFMCEITKPREEVIHSHRTQYGPYKNSFMPHTFWRLCYNSIILYDENEWSQFSFQFKTQKCNFKVFWYNWSCWQFLKKVLLNTYDKLTEIASTTGCIWFSFLCWCTITGHWVLNISTSWAWVMIKYNYWVIILCNVAH